MFIFDFVFVNDWVLELGDLIILWQVWVEIIFVVKMGLEIDFGIEVKVCVYSLFNYVLVDYWQYVWYGCIDQGDLGIGCCVKGCCCIGEEFGIGDYLCVDFQFYYDFLVIGCVSNGIGIVYFLFFLLLF